MNKKENYLGRNKNQNKNVKSRKVSKNLDDSVPYLLGL